MFCAQAWLASWLDLVGELEDFVDRFLLLLLLLVLLLLRILLTGFSPEALLDEPGDLGRKIVSDDLFSASHQANNDYLKKIKSQDFRGGIK